jgi:hypothetical protein
MIGWIRFQASIGWFSIRLKQRGWGPHLINEELIANIVTNAHMVPAGIVAVSRAQERGYTFAYAV